MGIKHLVRKTPRGSCIIYFFLLPRIVMGFDGVYWDLEFWDWLFDAWGLSCLDFGGV